MIKLGEGMSANVYSDGKYAYKKYKEGYNLENMKFEVAVQNEIFQNTNLKVAEYTIIDNMIRMTLLDGTNLADRILNENYLQGFHEFMDLQCETFKYKDLNLADSYKTFSKQIRASVIDESLKSMALKSIDRIEKKYHLCHFDFHPENVVYHEGVPYIIDWTNAKLGNPAMDIASTYIIFRLYAPQFAKPYLETMTNKGYEMSEVLESIPVMAFIRLRETNEKEAVESLKKFILGEDEILISYQES